MAISETNMYQLQYNALTTWYAAVVL